MGLVQRIWSLNIWTRVETPIRPLRVHLPQVLGKEKRASFHRNENLNPVITLVKRLTINLKLRALRHVQFGGG